MNSNKKDLPHSRYSYLRMLVVHHRRLKVIRTCYLYKPTQKNRLFKLVSSVLVCIKIDHDTIGNLRLQNDTEYTL